MGNTKCILPKPYHFIYQITELSGFKTVFQFFTWMIHLRLKLSLCSHPPLFPPSLKLVSTQEVQNSLSNIPLSKCFGLSTIWINYKRH